MVLYIAVKVAYIASDYHGWQIQPKFPTIEEKIRIALIKSKLVHQTKLHEFKYAGRTDRGVNAIGQTISFPITGYQSIPDRLLHRINAHLPDSIRCWAYVIVNSDFHPRFDAIERIYCYIWYEPGLSSLNWETVEKKAQMLVGTHDFQNFAKSDKSQLITKRSLSTLQITNHLNDTITIEFRAPSFLWQQCRRISGHLLQLAHQDIGTRKTLELLSKPVAKKPQPLPPEYLTLVDVHYHNLTFISDIGIIKKMLQQINLNLLEKKRIIRSIKSFKEFFEINISK